MVENVLTAETNLGGQMQTRLVLNENKKTKAKKQYKRFQKKISNR